MSAPPAADETNTPGHSRERRLFVEPVTYRRRRLMDAARALPVLGLFLWFLPVLWASGETPPRASTALIYIFGVWIVLVVLAGLLIRRLRSQSLQDEADQP